MDTVNNFESQIGFLQTDTGDILYIRTTVSYVLTPTQEIGTTSQIKGKEEGKE